MTMLRKKVFIIFLIVVIFVSCSKSENSSDFTNLRCNFQGDVPLEEHSGEYVSAFLEEYPDFEVTKIRWQMVPMMHLDSDIETYIIEGISGGEKVVIKYLMPDRIILGRVERPLSDEEVVDGVCVEKALVLSQMLTRTELSDIAQESNGGELIEIKVAWKKESPTAYLECIEKENFRVKSITVDAITGEIVNG